MQDFYGSLVEKWRDASSPTKIIIIIIILKNIIFRLRESIFAIVTTPIEDYPKKHDLLHTWCL